MFTTLHKKAIFISMFCFLNLSYLQAMRINSPADTQQLVLTKTPTELHLAAKDGNVEKIDFLVNTKKADINSTQCDFDATPLHTATWFSKSDSVKSLIQHGANPRSKNCYGNTPLHLAVFNHNLQCLQELLKPSNPIDLNYTLCTIENNDGRTPLDFAEILEFTEAINRIKEIIDSFHQLEQLLSDR